jgi:hypothetical protein
MQGEIGQLQQYAYVFFQRLHSVDEHEDKKQGEIYVGGP